MLDGLKYGFKTCPQIDGATGESETSGSVLERSVRCAQSLRNLGMKYGDLMVLMAPNHLDVTVPLYAALYLGLVVVAVDMTHNLGMYFILVTEFCKIGGYFIGKVQHWPPSR